MKVQFPQKTWLTKSFFFFILAVQMSTYEQSTVPTLHIFIINKSSKNHLVGHKHSIQWWHHHTMVTLLVIADFSLVSISVVIVAIDRVCPISPVPQNSFKLCTWCPINKRRCTLTYLFFSDNVPLKGKSLYGNF